MEAVAAARRERIATKLMEKDEAAVDAVDPATATFGDLASLRKTYLGTRGETVQTVKLDPETLAAIERGRAAVPLPLASGKIIDITPAPTLAPTPAPVDE